MLRKMKMFRKEKKKTRLNHLTRIQILLTKWISSRVLLHYVIYDNPRKKIQTIKIVREMIFSTN